MIGEHWASGVTVVGFDGDDTLWHCEDAFEAAHDRLVELLAGHATGDEVRARLDEVERRNLEWFGYGVKGFILSMIETAIELSGGAVPVADVHELLHLGRAMIARPVDLLPGVDATLTELSARYRLVLVTKGDLLHQETKIARSGLADRFESVHISSEKRADTYLRLLAHLGVAPERFLMVGNSEASDVGPVLAIGGWAAFVPYALTNAYERTDAVDAASPRLRRLERIDELPALLSRGGGCGESGESA